MKKVNLLWILFFLTLALLTGCEIPDPQDTVSESPEPTDSPTIQATSAPMQLYVVIVQPTVDPSQPQSLPGGDALVVPVPVAPTHTPTPFPPAIPIETPFPTPIPADYYLGWAWTNSLQERGGQIQVDEQGLILRDRPAIE